MYKAEELCGLLIKPKINDIDLDVLQDYYRKFLNPFIYQYDITENEKQSSIQLRFDEENFCHLLGIESIVKYSVSKKEIHHYKGQGGWDYIQNTGLCFNDLKRMNKSKFKSIKAKFVYFYLMPDILENPVAVCNLLEYLTQRDIQTKNSGVNVRYRGKHRFFKGFNEFIKEKTRRCDNDFEKIERHVFF